MNVWKFIKKTVLNACFYFTIAEFAILIVAALMQMSSPESGGTAVMFLNLPSTSLIFLSCLILSALNFIWHLEYSGTLKVLIHFFGMLAAYALVFIVIPKSYDNAARVISLLALYAGIYLVVGLIVLVINSIRKNRRSDELEYEAQFGELHNNK